MKSLLPLVLLTFLTFAASANTYYFSSSGDDSRSATEAQNSAKPWKTIAKLNSIFSTLQPGDLVLFKRGDTFYGSIAPTKSGTSNAPITIGAYGTGPRPVITGFTTLTNWSSAGGGKYVSSNLSFESGLNMVAVNGMAKEMGRYPNSNDTSKGYLYFESHGSNSITDNELSSSTNWTGAEMVIRTRHWVIDRVKVTGQSGKKITYSPAATYEPYDDYGYFFQNDLRTLDQTGEWYYNPAAKKFYMYFGTNAPSSYNVQVSTVPNVVYLYNQDNIVFQDLAIEGGNENGFYIYSADNIRLQSCYVLCSGYNGIWAQNTNNLDVENCKVANTNVMGIYLYSNNNSSVIRNDTIKNSGVFAGMGQNGGNTSCGIRVSSDNNLIEYNKIDSSGFCGVRFAGDNIIIKNNLITNFSFVKDDGGGIYTASPDGSSANHGRQIIGNIILNGIGAPAGTTSLLTQSSSSGIYFDNNSSGIFVGGNTVSNCGKVGFYIHNCYDVSFSGNTSYNNTAQALLNHDSPLHPTLTKVTFKNNILVSKTTAQKVAMFNTRDNDIAHFGTIDSNYYARPIFDSLTIQESTGVVEDRITTKHTLESWEKKYPMYDKHSKTSPQTFDSTLNPDDYIRFEYNASTSPKTVILSDTYVDVANKSYSGSVTIPAYGSLVLIKSKSTSKAPSVAFTSPTANAVYNNGPANILLTATATDMDGTIRKVEFYNGKKLIHTEYYAPYSWTWGNVAAGTYTFTAKAYDNSGNVAFSAPVTVTVKSASAKSIAASGSISMSTTTNLAQANKASVTKENSTQPFSFELYPNPAVNTIVIATTGATTNGNAVLMIQDLSGRTIQRKTVNVSDNRFEVNVSALSSGTYIISITTGNTTVVSRKFIKMN